MSQWVSGVVAEALERWSLRASSAEPLSSGAVNQHWRILTDDADLLVLRRYNPLHSDESIPYEHAILHHLKALGWPVAIPILSTAREGIVVTDAGRWTLFPYLPGSPPEHQDLLNLQRKGIILALVQRDLATWDAPGQRPGFGRVTDVAASVRASGFDSFEAVVARLAESDSSRAAKVTELRRRNLVRLEKRGYANLPDTTIYYECLGSNVLFVGNEVTALLDFDFAHRDARVVDVARSLEADCGVDVERIARWIGGYATFAEPALSVEEADVIPDLMLSCALWNTVVPLSIAATGGPAWMLESARQSIDVVLPALERSREVLRAVTHEAAGFAVGRD